MQNLTEVARSKDLLLKVVGHSVTMAMSDGELIKSKKLSVGGHDWEVHWRPKNHWAGRHRPVTLNLVLLSEALGGDVKAKLSCRLVDPAGRLEPSEEKSISHKFYKSGDYSGALEVTAREDLEASGYLADDSYTVQSSITVLKGAPAAPNTAATAMDRDRLPDAALPSLDLHRHLGELLQKGTGADVTFLVSGEEFAAHKAILASRSPVFMAELFGGMKEAACQRIEVKDMEPAAFKALLRFIYTDTALDLDQKGEDATSRAQHLLAGADRYGLQRLKLICEGRLADCITVDMAATTLALAEQHGCSQLKASCVEFIAGYLDAVLETEGYKHLEASCPSVLTDILRATRRPTN
ncbi:BTB/POZ and MATH domain-containing protein 1-like [Miscanthus floridulus]|uniref:BTB/POZ and MATH domain-containing protein 1-like n=1 Tax=Miscanthus floridulus TaxID=154761 RepID=UPI0034587B4D